MLALAAEGLVGAGVGVDGGGDGHGAAAALADVGGEGGETGMRVDSLVGDVDGPAARRPGAMRRLWFGHVRKDEESHFFCDTAPFRGNPLLRCSSQRARRALALTWKRCRPAGAGGAES